MVSVNVCAEVARIITLRSGGTSGSAVSQSVSDWLNVGRPPNVSDVFARLSRGESVTDGVSASVDWPSGSAATKRPFLINRQLAKSSHPSARGHAARLIRKIFAIDLAAMIRFDQLAVEQRDTAAMTVDVPSSA